MAGAAEISQWFRVVWSSEGGCVAKGVEGGCESLWVCANPLND